jgi:hypothetical protein
MFEVLFGIFILVFLTTFVSALTGFWRVRGMTNKIFTLAERELDRKLQEGPTGSSRSEPEATTCSHCGSRLTAQVDQCPNCGAGLK